MNARDRIAAAEVKFSELTGGGRELVEAASEPQFKFCDGEITKTWSAAADHAERIVTRTEETIRKNSGN
jgi:hypothetical protein